MAMPSAAIVVANGLASEYVVGFGGSVHGVDLSGVVALVIGSSGCSGSLLADGRSILTAAHCVNDAYGQPLPTSGTAYFQKEGGGFVPLAISSFFVNPGWTGSVDQGSDLAVLRLDAIAPAFAARYPLYNSFVTTSPIVMAGYGLGGTDETGAILSFGTLRAGTNAYAFLDGAHGDLLLGQLYVGTNYIGANPTYSATDLVTIAHGDSGGPSFYYDGSLVGVHDAIACVTSTCAALPSGNQFGEVFWDTNVPYHLAWIQDQQVPEPAAAFLMLLGLAAGTVLRRRARVGRGRPS